MFHPRSIILPIRVLNRDRDIGRGNHSGKFILQIRDHEQDQTVEGFLHRHILRAARITGEFLNHECIHVHPASDLRRFRIDHQAYHHDDGARISLTHQKE